MRHFQVVFPSKMSSKFLTPDIPAFQHCPSGFKLINCGQRRGTTSGGKERRSHSFLKNEKRCPYFEKKCPGCIHLWVEFLV